jgi:hypothetical protein
MALSPDLREHPILGRVTPSAGAKHRWACVDTVSAGQE